ncbi:TetR/AcrR family transcriptional regulator [Euzebya sp.]|uniref:TetR/AcrR family transcriptional regulator n=1 Tax=Euzebya sp. TaxID=1971409 RepID=UPI003513DC04
MKRTSVDQVLDATRAAVLDLGVRRTTFAEVARRAGVSRATLYTHYPDVEAAVTAVLTRELGAVLAAARGPAGSAPHARARLVGTIRRAVTALVGDPLLAKALAVDADTLVPYVVSRFGAVQRIALDLVVEGVRAGHEDGSVRHGDPGVLGLTVVLAVQSLVLAQRVPEVAAVGEGLADALADVVDRGLSP